MRFGDVPIYLALVGANVALVLPDIPPVGTRVGALAEVALVVTEVGTDVVAVGLDLLVILPQIRPVPGEILAVPVDVITQRLDVALLIHALMRLGDVPIYLALVGANVLGNDIYRDRQDLARDRSDLRRDDAQIQAHRGDFRNGGDDDFRRGWRHGDDRGLDGNGRWDKGVQGMTPQTLANNAAAEKNKPPATKPQSQHWYHYFMW
jgi:hypothetical protein